MYLDSSVFWYPPDSDSSVRSIIHPLQNWTQIFNLKLPKMTASLSLLSELYSHVVHGLLLSDTKRFARLAHNIMVGILTIGDVTL